jgi:hypothetical protein
VLRRSKHSLLTGHTVETISLSIILYQHKLWYKTDVYFYRPNFLPDPSYMYVCISGLMKWNYMERTFQYWIKYTFSWIKNNESYSMWKRWYHWQSSNNLCCAHVELFKPYSFISIIKMVDMKFRWEEPKHPESVCSRPCRKGEAHHMIDGSACCWTCSPCHLFQYLPTKYACVDCPSGTIPSFDRQSCVEIPIIYLR